MFEENKNLYNNNTDHNATEPENRGAGQIPNPGTYGQYNHNPNRPNGW